MLQSADTGERSLEAYRGVAPDDTLEQLGLEADRLRGARGLHINATPYSGGVSQLLRSTVPLLNVAVLAQPSGKTGGAAARAAEIFENALAIRLDPAAAPSTTAPARAVVDAIESCCAYRRLAIGEERDGAVAFGAEWKGYAARTPRFVPRLGRRIRVARTDRSRAVSPVGPDTPAP
jgi:hypothetical protein